jgi:hypothetical protein
MKWILEVAVKRPAREIANCSVEMAGLPSPRILHHVMRTRTSKEPQKKLGWSAFPLSERDEAEKKFDDLKNELDFMPLRVQKIATL